MKREELEEIGLTSEQVDSVLDLHHTEIDPINKELGDVKADLEAEKKKTGTQQETIRGLKKDLEGFKDVDVSGMKKQIEDLEEDIRKKDEDHAREIADRDFNDILRESISTAKGRNAKAITALLDVEALKASKNQKDDIAAALKELAEAEDSAMLFGEPEANPTGKGNPIGNVGGTHASQEEKEEADISGDQLIRRLKEAGIGTICLDDYGIIGLSQKAA